MTAACDYCGVRRRDMRMEPCAGRYYLPVALPTVMQIHLSKNDAPGLVLFIANGAEGYIDINYCPKCGRKLDANKQKARNHNETNSGK
jgi:hypothetical protein